MRISFYLDSTIVYLNVSENGTFAYSTADLPGGLWKFRAKKYESIEYIAHYGKHSMRGLVPASNTFSDIMDNCLNFLEVL